MAAKTSVNVSLDVDRLIREEANEWFTANRKDLEAVMRRVADRVRHFAEREVEPDTGHAWSPVRGRP